MIEQELHNNAAVITKVSETASKEFAIESALDKMQGAWAAVKLVIEEYRETGKLTLRALTNSIEKADARFVSYDTRGIQPKKRCSGSRTILNAV